jgi:hypothetical protein
MATILATPKNTAILILTTTMIIKTQSWTMSAKMVFAAILSTLILTSRHYSTAGTKNLKK